MKVIGIIPARMGSSRFPGKPLAEIRGMPMVGHCYLRAQMCSNLDYLCVATCDEEIFEYVTSIGGNAVMTSNKHERATDRAAEALLKVEDQIGENFDVVVMIQGDEPMTTPQMISSAVAALESDPSVDVVNLLAEIKCMDEFNDPNEVKVVISANSDALYFSREPRPSVKKFSGKFPMYKQVCVIPFRREALIEFNATPETPLEIIESVDMMRILENGGIVRMVPSPDESWSVDTLSDLEFVKSKMASDALADEYLGCL